jgi:hypothetical protein
MVGRPQLAREPDVRPGLDPRQGGEFLFGRRRLQLKARDDADPAG